MEIRVVEISQLKRAEYNPRKELTPADPEYQQLKKSIVEFGYVVPVVINSDMTVIGGHLACEQLSRPCYMMELDPKYCDVIVKRWETLTGKKAELEKK